MFLVLRKLNQLINLDHINHLSVIGRYLGISFEDTDKSILGYKYLRIEYDDDSEALDAYMNALNFTDMLTFEINGSDIYVIYKNRLKPLRLKYSNKEAALVGYNDILLYLSFQGRITFDIDLSKDLPKDEKDNNLRVVKD